MKRGKKYLEAVKLYDKNKLYVAEEAVGLVKKTSITKFDASVEVAFRLNLDPRQAEQNLRGAIVLPHGTGKTQRVVVIADGEKIKEAEAAGADRAGDDELIEEISKGWLEFDVLVATPSMMGKLGKLGRVLGPKGLMPNPKTGTVTMDVAKAVTDIKGGKIEFRIDKNSNLHFPIGRSSFSEQQLAENYTAALDEIARAKPSSTKGRYIKKAVMSSAMGPGIPVEVGASGSSDSED